MDNTACNNLTLKDEMHKSIEQLYGEGVQPEVIAVQLYMSTYAVVLHLTRVGIMKPKVTSFRATTKAEIVERLSGLLNVRKLESLEKASKPDLETLLRGIDFILGRS